MKRFLGTAVAALAVCSPLHAQYGIVNDTDNTIFVAHAFASDSGVGCGYDDHCSGPDSPNGQDNFLAGFRVQGWFAIPPHKLVVIQDEPFHNARHQVFAQDGLGHVWGDFERQPDVAFCLSNHESQDHCGNVCEGGTGGRDDTFNPVFFAVRNSTCCGFTCGSTDFATHFGLSADGNPTIRSEER